jgi:MFS family permease
VSAEDRRPPEAAPAVPPAARSGLRRRLPATVVALGVVSLLTDLSSEMIYPLLPLFLTGVLGATAVSIGVIEGAAESAAALLKIVSGRLSDRTRRKPWLLAGYGLAGLARPLIGLATGWVAVLGLRVTDRVGKGLRGAPRDALIGDVTPPAQRGAAFGLHRAFDNTGALLGPLVAAALLSGLGWSLRHVFLAAAVPAAAVIVVLLAAVREPERPAATTEEERPEAAARQRSAPLLDFSAWRALGTPYRRLVVALLLFTLGNSTDAFLLLRLSDAGIGASQVALLWALHSGMKAATALVAGRASDRLGRRPLMLTGFAVYALVYVAFAVAGGSRALLVAAFVVYGLSIGLTEPVEKAWVVDLVPATLRGSGLGLWQGAVGLAALPASLLFGALWTVAGAPVAFLTGAGLATVAALLLLRVPAAAKADLSAR